MVTKLWLIIILVICCINIEIFINIYFIIISIVNINIVIGIVVLIYTSLY